MARLDDQALAVALRSLGGWSVDEAGLFRELRFPDFATAFAFLTEVALLAERADHHPDWSQSWGTVRIHVVSHAEGGITERCVALARAIDGAAARRRA